MGSDERVGFRPGEQPGEAHDEWHDEPRGGRLWVWWLVRLVGLVVVAAMIGAATGGLYYLVRSGDTWRDLAAAVVGMIVAALVLAPGWLLCLVLLLRRFAPEGRRLAAGAVALGALAVVAIGLTAVVAALPDDARWAGVAPGGVAVVVTGLVAVVVPPVVVRATSARRAREG